MKDERERERGERMEISGEMREASALHERVMSFGISSERDSINERNDDEIELQWAAIERLPTIKRFRTCLFNEERDGRVGENGITATDVRKLGAVEKHFFIEKLIKHVEEDNRRLLEKLRERLDKVDVKLPTVEIRYKDLCVQAQCTVVHGKSLPTIWNALKSIFSIFRKISGCKSQEAKLPIIKEVSGIIKPSRLTLLLGPPGSGRTTLLKALAGKLGKSLQVKGEITYNGCIAKKCITQQTSAYISQHDLHIPQMTVRETIDFSARCQGVGSRTEIMKEVSRREKQAGIIPEPDMDTYMKAISIGKLKRFLQTDYTLKILGLDICADTIVGDAMRRGISGGQKRRLATGEMIVGPKRALFLDEISNGLDTSTTFQVVTCLQQLVHITDATALVSLLQPAPETFDLFDDIILFAEGKVVYHGPRSDVLKFFEECGFKCPKRKGVADFLQEVLSRKDQEQYWYHTDLPYRYISVDNFCEKFKACHIGQKLYEDLSKAYDETQIKQKALSFSNHSMTKLEIFKACMARELLLMRRNSSLHVFKLVQLGIIAIITMTVFLRTRMDIDVVHANYYMSSLFYGIIRISTNGIAELSMTFSRLPVFYKQRDNNFYPTWAYSIPASILKVPVSLVESFLWTGLTYFVIGYSPEIERFFCQFLVFFALHQASTSLFRFLASICQSEVVATSGGVLSLLLMFLFGGFIIPRSSMPAWLKWAFWISPLSYAEIGVSLNEFFSPRWQKVTSPNSTIAQEVLSIHGLNMKRSFYWISLGIMFGFILFFNIGFTLALTYLKRTSQAIISHEKLHQLQKREDSRNETEQDNKSTLTASPLSTAKSEKTGRMVLQFQPLTIVFQDLQYFVDTPPEMRKQGFKEKRLQLLHDITGAFKPGILTAIMGVSGAGKTTLMDVLAGRKNSGTIKGEIRIGGYPKVQKTFARISSYCEQNDIHSPQITVEESVIYAAWLRLPSQIDPKTKAEFVNEVLERIELDGIKDALVGIPGVSGLSNEQRKRLTIAVEFVSNPSVIFMDEPTSGLDARAAAIVMRAVQNVVETGRTVVCTIHQPSIDIFEAFDELILMKKGGQIIYSGPLGHHSAKLIDYFEGIPGLPKIKENYNPATWMLEVTTSSTEAELGFDFSHLYRGSSMYRDNIELVKQLSKPPVGSREMHFPSPFPCNTWQQFRSCLWKQHLSYWRSPGYNLMRFIFIIISSVFLGALLWQKGKKINDEQDLFNIFGSMFIVANMIGINNCSSILPFVARERTIFYRERFCGMYSSWAYSFAQVTIEFPYLLLQTILFVIITYPAIGYYWTAYKVFWYFHATFCYLLYFTYVGMLIMSVSPDSGVAAILANACYTMLSLFSGYLMPKPKIPKWWLWCYWITPASWHLNGIILSQYSDTSMEITAFGEHKTINSFLEDYFGYNHDMLGVVAIVLATFPIAAAILYAFFIGKLNFQKR